MRFEAYIVLIVVAVGGFALDSRADSSQPGKARPEAPPVAGAEGRPKLVLDHLELPDELPDAWYFKQKLREILRREARRATWGAGRESTITYRYYVKELRLVQTGDVLRVTCHAVGELPKGKTARGLLTFSGPASQRNEVVTKVLEIVARGVITRLAELERDRRRRAAIR